MRALAVDHNELAPGGGQPAMTKTPLQRAKRLPVSPHGLFARRMLKPSQCWVVLVSGLFAISDEKSRWVRGGCRAQPHRAPSAPTSGGDCDWEQGRNQGQQRLQGRTRRQHRPTSLRCDDVSWMRNNAFQYWAYLLTKHVNQINFTIYGQ